MILPLLRRLHRWIGLLIALPIAVQGLSGCVMALADLLPDRQTVAASPRPAGEVVAAAQQHAGRGAHATRYFAPQGAGYEARVQVMVPGEAPHMLHIDPASLAILAVDPFAERALLWVRSLHEQWLMPAYGGRSIVGWLGVGLLALLLTAVPIWWPRGNRAGSGTGSRPAGSIGGRPVSQSTGQADGRSGSQDATQPVDAAGSAASQPARRRVSPLQQAFLPDFRARGVIFHRRLHGAAGAWIFGILLVLAVTGITAAFPRATRSLMGLEQREPPSGQRSGGGSAAPATDAAADLDRVIGLAQQAVPGAALRAAFLPLRQGEPTRLMFAPPGKGGAVNVIQVQVNPTDGRVRVADDPAMRKPAESVYRWMHDLHTGNGIVDVWRLAQAAGGLSLPLL